MATITKHDHSYYTYTILPYLSQPSPGVWCYSGTESSHPSNTDGVMTQAVMYKHVYYKPKHTRFIVNIQ